MPFKLITLLTGKSNISGIMISNVHLLLTNDMRKGHYRPKLFCDKNRNVMQKNMKLRNILGKPNYLIKMEAKKFGNDAYKRECLLIAINYAKVSLSS